MALRIAVVTGGNAGLGYETIKALMQSAQPYRIFLGCRSTDKGQAAIAKLQSEVPKTASKLDLLQLDTTSDASIKAAVAAVQKETDHVDVLVNNAGKHRESSSASQNLDPIGVPATRDIWARTMDVNVAGTYETTVAFAPLLVQSRDKPRLIFVSSSLGSIGTVQRGLYPPLSKPEAKGWPKPELPAYAAYRASKAALNMTMLLWHNLLQADDVRVFALCPGFLATNLAYGNPEELKAMGAADPAIGGQFIRDVIAGARDADAGKLIGREGLVDF